MVMSLTRSMRMLLALAATALLGGCQLGASVPPYRLIEHQAMIDPSGLNESSICGSVKVHVEIPQKWSILQPKRTAIYTHQQWRSPSGMTGLGVCYIHLPIPMSADLIVWLAKREYGKHSDDGHLLAQWRDSLGRPWFEAETRTYHVRGYVVSRGFEAWIIYCGYKTEQAPRAAELGVAARSLETIVPTPFANELPQRPLAQAAADRGRAVGG